MYGLGSAGLLLLVGRSVALTVNLCCPEGTVNEVSIKRRRKVKYQKYRLIIYKAEESYHF